MSETTGTLDTKIGTVRYHMTDADHVWFRTEAPEAVTIRGIRYHLNYHCHLIDGTWVRNDWNEPYLSRKGAEKEASQAARTTARDILDKAWTDYLAQNPGLTRLAARAHAVEQVEKLRLEVVDLEEKLHAKVAELKAAMKILDSI
jgi:hypothetical protein